MRSEAGFKKRYFWFWNQGLFQVFVLTAYGILGTLFINFPKKFQWTLAFVCPIFRDFVAWGTLKLAAKAAGKDGAKKPSVTLTISHFIGSKYSIFLAIIVGGVANPLTANCLIGINFIEKMYNCSKIVWKHKKHNADVKGKLF